MSNKKINYWIINIISFWLLFRLLSESSRNEQPQSTPQQDWNDPVPTVKILNSPLDAEQLEGQAQIIEKDRAHDEGG